MTEIVHTPGYTWVVTSQVPLIHIERENDTVIMYISYQYYVLESSPKLKRICFKH